MSNFKSVVERTVHLHLQHLTSFQPIPLWATLILFSSLSFVSAPSASLSALATTLTNAISPSHKRLPFLTSLFHTVSRALHTACLRVRIHVHLPLPSRWRELFSRHPRGSRADETYATPRAEARYWRVAGRYRRRLYSGNIPITGTSSGPSTTCKPRETAIPLVTYYTPRLLPLYRDRIEKRTSSTDTDEGRIAPKTFCKWHRMVFPDARPPTLAQAAVQMKYYSNRDLREMQHIARMVPDEQVFGSKERTRKAKQTTKYGEMWQCWLENKGMDLVIVFE